MHVMFLDDGIMYRAIGMGLCEKMQASPALNDLFPTARFKGDMAAGVNIGMTGIAYNKKMFTEKGWAPPTSWMDMANPKYKGKVVFQSLSSSTFGLHGFLLFNRIQGGNDKNVELGFKAWPTTIGPNVLEYIPSSAKLAEMVQTGEAAMFPLTPTAVGVLKEKGLPVEYVQPKEGSAVLTVGECVIAKNSETRAGPQAGPVPAVAGSPGRGARVRRPDPVQPQNQGQRQGRRAGDPDERVHEDRHRRGLGRDQRKPPGLERALEQDGRALILFLESAHLRGGPKARSRLARFGFSLAPPFNAAGATAASRCPPPAGWRPCRRTPPSTSWPCRTRPGPGRRS